MPKKIILIIFIITLIVFAVLVATGMYLPKAPVQPRKVPMATASSNSLSFLVKSSNTNIRVGDKVNVGLFLEGNDVKDVTGFDVKIDYDHSKLRLDKAEQGNLFGTYMVIKWDITTARFVATINPSDANIKPQIGSPLLTLEFTAISKSSLSPVSLSPTSIVALISRKEGSYPKSNTVSFVIK